MPCRVIKVKLTELAKRDTIQLFAKRDTQVSRYDERRKKTVVRKIYEGTYIEGSFSMPQNDNTVTIFINKCEGGIDNLPWLPIDYYWLTPADFDWHVSIPVKVDL